jgi:hypothetical protein
MILQRPIAIAGIVATTLCMNAACGQSGPSIPGSNAREIAPGVVGDGVHDDTAGLQALLDARTCEVRIPAAPVCLSISKTLKIHSGQTLILARNAVVRLQDHADQVMLTNDDHEQGNENIAVGGGVWDMNNLGHSLTRYQQCVQDGIAPPDSPYDAQAFSGVLMRFNGVKNLAIRGLTLKDPVTFGIQLGNLRQFTIEDITFDYNLQRNNMDGVHLNGNCRWGRIANLKGTTNDDLVALNADDGGWGEMSRGPIEDVSIDGIFAENGYTAVRLLSAGSPIRRIQIANIFGTYRFNVVSFTNHHVHPNSASTFDDISLRGLFCSKSAQGMKIDPLKPGPSMHALIWVDAPAVVSSLTISDLHRTESAWASETMTIESGATVDSLQMSNVSLINRLACPMDLITNWGTIANLSLVNAYAKAEDSPQRGALVRNHGTIQHPALQQVFGVHVLPDVVDVK